MDVAGLDNDTRGWIMCIVSGCACVLGASLICVDKLIRLMPGMRDFDIQKSTGFQAASYSLSFGVMIFSALYKMLPSSKKSLMNGGFSESNAAWILLGCFSAGFLGLQALLRLVHPWMHTEVVECDHEHENTSKGESVPYPSAPGNAHMHFGDHNESTPLLQQEDDHKHKSIVPKTSNGHIPAGDSYFSDTANHTDPRRKSLFEVPERVTSFVLDRKNRCDSVGPCFGYTNPCGRECFNAIAGRRPSLNRTRTTSRNFLSAITHTASESASESNSNTLSQANNLEQQDHDLHADQDLEAGQHHHHVPENRYLATGLQTSIAIALHKLPEGFIMYATNHASPSLGVTVFFALFIHNITEGFVMALPLYLALRSRTRAMLYSCLLGGLSQPAGAALAVLWLKIAGSEPGEAGYGYLFGITSGLMTGVALHLISEGLTLDHRKSLCVMGGFAGIFIMMVANALTR